MSFLFLYFKILAGIPPITQSLGILSTTTAPAAIVTLSPIVMGPRIVTPVPM